MTTENFIAIIGVNLAIISIFSAVLISHFNGRIKKRGKDIDRISNVLCRQELQINAFSEIVKDSSIRALTHELAFGRLLACPCVDGAIAQRILLAFDKNNNDHDRVINEMFLFSTNAPHKLAAYRQLSESCGNSRSIVLMNEAAAHEPNCDKDIYSNCIRRLLSRLDTT
ncbi:MAG: hypothetical protein HZB71_12260 [Betaproteobacteria bacterium]|nr:hypothetical protein [Betaproteobacteria bacterium]